MDTYPMYPVGRYPLMKMQQTVFRNIGI